MTDDSGRESTLSDMVASGAAERANWARTTAKWVKIAVDAGGPSRGATAHGRICSRDRKERLEANPEFPWRFSGDFERGRRSGRSHGAGLARGPGIRPRDAIAFGNRLFRAER